MSVPLLADITEVITLSATPGVATELLLDKDVRTLSIQGRDATGLNAAACSYSMTGTDNTAIDAGAFSIPSGALLPVAVSGRGRNLAGTSVFVASAIVSAKVQVITSSQER